jgi:type II secretory pathway component PulF
MKFNFKAKDQAGEYREGVIDASSKDAAVEVLQKNNLLPIKVREETEGDEFTKAFLKFYDRVTEKELVVFFRQLAILVEARVPIIVSLTAIREQTLNKYFVKIIGEMVNDIEDGMAFSGSMEKHRDIFSNLSINIIKAGEASGSLKKSIDYVAENIERNYTLSGRIKSALIYPGIVLIVFFIIGFIMVSFIIPKLTTVIKELGADIPWYTAVVIAVGDFMSKYWWAAAIIILGFVGGIFYYVKTPEGKKEWDQIKIRLPIVGPIFRFVYITRFAENLSVLLVGGIPIERALIIISDVVNNVVYREIFLKTAEEVKKGGNMSTVLRKNPLIPPMVTHMVKIGEDSGQIDSVLGHIAKFYDQEVEMMTKNLSTLLEPVLMVVIGIAVGFMAISILMPIYNVASQIK